MTKELTKTITRDVVLTLIIIAGLISFFYNPLSIDMRYLQTLAGVIVGFYSGIKTLPVISAMKK